MHGDYHANLDRLMNKTMSVKEVYEIHKRYKARTSHEKSLEKKKVTKNPFSTLRECKEKLDEMAIRKWSPKSEKSKVAADFWGVYNE